MARIYVGRIAPDKEGIETGSLLAVVCGKGRLPVER
jgi:hypothetical protein